MVFIPQPYQLRYIRPFGKWLGLEELSCFPHGGESTIDYLIGCSEAIHMIHFFRVAPCPISADRSMNHMYHACIRIRVCFENSSMVNTLEIW